MKGVVLSLWWAGAAAIAAIALFHLRPVRHRFGVICVLAGIGLGGFLASGRALPASPEPVVDLLNGAYLYLFWIFGVLAQVYSLADRGFSLTMLTDFGVSGRVSRARDEIKHGYAGGQGMAHVRAKRFAQIERGGFIRRDGDGYVATPAGRLVGRVCWALQRLYRFHETG